MNTITISGNLVQKPEIKQTQNGYTIANFSIANTYYQAKEKRTCFFNVQCWNALAEFVHKWLDKGAPVFISGALRINNYVDKDGNQRNFYYIEAREIEFGSDRQSKQKQETTINKKAPLEELEPEDLPF